MDELPENRLYRIIDIIRRNPEIVVLSILVFLYMILANIYAYPATFNGSYFPTSGGSDPYYNLRSILYTIEYHKWMTYDPALNYPLGALNPRTPYFHFLIILSAYIVSPFENIYTAATVGLLELDAVFGALLIIPVYLITREMFGKRAGIIGALLYALMPSNLSAGILSDGRMHTPELLFAFFSIYFFQKALNNVSKRRIFDSLLNVRAYYGSVRKYLQENRLGMIYILLGGVSQGALALAWQGYAYIEAIIVIYIFVQLIFNLFLKRPTGYIIVLTTLFFIAGLSLPAYYYITLGNAHGWYYPPLYLALVAVGFSSIVAILGRKPWIISVTILAVISGLAFVAIDTFFPSFVAYLIGGAGYFIKTRVYQTIGEASAPPLGQYIGGFGAAQFVLGLSGMAYVVYFYMREKKDSSLFVLVFSLVSIYMSFAAARFNITAAPAYAALGAGLLIFFSDAVKLQDLKKRRASVQMGIRKSIRGNIKGLHVAFVVLIVLSLIIPSGTAMVNAAVPANNAASINNEIYHALPSFLRPSNYSASNGQYVGTYGFYITNDTQPLSLSLLWLGNQDLNVPLDQRPGFVSWWDYGFQELIQGKHPTVADDFQQGYQVAGQVLLAQNQSVDIALFLARDIQAAYQHNGNSLPASVFSTISQNLGYAEAQNITAYLTDPLKYTYLIQNNPAVYGNYIKAISSQNAYFALVSGQLAGYFSTDKIVNTYQAVSQETGYYIKYISTPSNLFPFSGNNTGIFYAPAYLTDQVSYNYKGEIVPYKYYNIYAVTQNATYPLNKLPTGEIPIGYNIQYNPDFYNTSIYRFMVGYPPTVVGRTSGIPGYTFGQNNMSLEPAWNMSHFIIDYYPLLYNPYTDYQSHPTAWKLISLQKGYQYQQEKKGTVLLFPPASQILGAANPIVAYYPGAIITGRVTTASGLPVQGAFVTIYDQYGIPHQYVRTNSGGYYNITGLPGNDTVVVSNQKFSDFFLSGSNIITSFKVNVTQDQANRIPTSYNETTGLPSYYITHNYAMDNSSVSGSVNLQYQYLQQQTKSSPGYHNVRVNSGQVVYSNSTYNTTITANITEGQYSIHDLPPYNYTVSIVTGGKTYSDVLHAVAQPGTSTVYDLFAQFDVIFTHVISNKGALSGYTVTARSSGQIFSNTTNATGSAILWVEPGSYSLVASNPNSVSVAQHYSFSKWGLNNTTDLAPVVSADLHGTISGYSGAVNISFLTNGLVNGAFTETTSSTGSYNVALPLGMYTVYAKSSDGRMVFIKTIQVSGNDTLDIAMSTAANVTVTAGISGQKQFAQEFEVLSTSALLQTNMISDHNFTVLLPENQYQFVADGIVAGNPYYGFSGNKIVANTSFSITMTASPHNLSVNVFDKSLGTSFDSKTELSGNTLVLYYSNYPVYFTSSPNATTVLYYPDLAMSMLSLMAYNPTYHSASVAVTSGTVNIGLNPVLVNVTFVLGGTGVNGTLILTGPESLALTVSDGVAQGQMVSGIYTMKVQSKVMYFNLTDSTVAIPAVQNFTFVPGYQKVFSVSVPGKPTLRVFNGAGIEMNPGYLPEGNYTVYVSSSSGVSISRVYVYQNTTLNPAYETGFSVQIANSLSQTGGYYLVKQGDFVMNTTGYELVLPSGQFSFSYYTKTVTSAGDFVVAGQQSLLVSSSASVIVPVSRIRVLSVISGQISGANTTEVYAYSSAGTLVNQTVSNGNGAYSLGLSGGSYTLYALNAMGNSAFIRSYTFKAFTNYGVNITMSRAYKTYIHTALNGTPIFVDVSIVTKNLSYEFNSSNSYIVLPVNSYGFGASEKRVINTYTNSTMNVTYQTNVTLTVNTVSYVNLNLAKIDLYSFNLTQVTKAVTALPGSDVLYNFTLKNTGNTVTKIKLESGNSTWPMQFGAANLTLSPGQEVSDNVTLTNVSSYAESGLNTIPVSINYGKSGVYTGYVKVNVGKIKSFKMQSLYPVAVLNGSKFEIPVNLTNTGNTPVTVSLDLNTSVLATYGWSANMTYLGSDVSSVRLGFNQTVTLNVVINPNGSTQLEGGNLTLTATGPAGTVNPQPLVMLAKYPTPPKVVTYPTGPSILANYTGNPLSNLVSGIIIIVVAVIAGIILTAIRGRKRGGGR